MTRIAMHRQRVLILGALACLVLTSVFGVAAQSESTARVTNTGGDGLNLRAEANGSSPILALEPEGAILTVTGPEQFGGGRAWRPVRSSSGQTGWAAAEYLILDGDVAPNSLSSGSTTVGAAITLTRTPAPSSPASSTVTLLPTRTPAPVPPLDLDVRIKSPEIDRREEQGLVVFVSRGNTPVRDAIVRFIVEDEDPEIEREASPTNESGRSHYDWSMRKYRGTTTLNITAEAPDGGKGKAKKSFFVR